MPKLVLALALAGSFGLSYVIGAALNPASDSHSGGVTIGDGGGVVAPRVAVSAGVIPGVGPYGLLYSKDAHGASCVGIGLPGPANRRILSEACGGPEAMNVGVLERVGDGFAVLVGKVPQGTTSIELSTPGMRLMKLRTADDPNGIDGRFIVARVDSRRLQDAHVRAVGPTGRTLALQAVPQD